MGSVVIGEDSKLTLSDLAQVARAFAPVELDPKARSAMGECHRFFGEAIESRIPIYGLNTQFGDQVVLLDKHLDDYETDRYQSSLTNRQNNLIRSHNCGLGEVAPIDAVRGAFLLRSKCLSRGYSGVRPEVVDAYIAFLNLGVSPVCYRYGSIGASGDLIPLATIAAAVVGEDVDVRFDGETVGARALMRRLEIEPLRIEGREGPCAHQRHVIHEQRRGSRAP